MKIETAGRAIEQYRDYYQNIRTFYIYGADSHGKRAFDQLIKFLQTIEDTIDFEIVFVDDNVEKQKSRFCNSVVISHNRFYERFRVGGNDIVLLCLRFANGTAAEVLEKLSHSDRFIHKINLFYGNDISLSLYQTSWAYLRKGKTYMSYTSILITTKCNLRCDGCLLSVVRRKKHWSVSFEQFCASLDSFFSLVDYVGMITFGFGEDFLYEELARAIEYTVKNYYERFGKIEIITNGSIIPDEKTIVALADKKIHVIVDDYRHNVPQCRETYPEVIRKLSESGVQAIETTRAKWFGGLFDVCDAKHMESHYINHFDTCFFGSKNQLYWGYKDKTMVFSCLVSFTAYEFDDVEFDEQDYLDYSKCTRAELVEFHLGMTEKGYVNACRICNGVHEGTPKQWIESAVQVPRSPLAKKIDV